MTLIPPGPPHLAALRQELADTAEAFDGIAETLPQVNLPDLHHRAQTVLATARTILRAHAETPGPDIAPLLDSLIRGLIELDVPTRDPDLGITRTLVQLQQAVGLALARLSQAQKAAAAQGWIVTDPTLPAALETTIARDEAPQSLARIAQGLDLIARRLDRIETAATAPPNGNAPPSVQQQGLVNLYLGEMRIHLDIARMQLIIGERTIDFAALWRAADAMADLTEGMVATIRALATRFAPALRTAVERTRRSLGTVIRYVATTAGRIVANRNPVDPDPAPPPADPPPDFSIDEVHRRILANEPVPISWHPFVPTLDFSPQNERQSATGTIARLTRRVLGRADTLILRSAAPLAPFTALQRLHLSGTGITDLTPLSGLANLLSLSLTGTGVTDLTPLDGLAKLQQLWLTGLPPDIESALPRRAMITITRN